MKNFSNIRVKKIKSKAALTTAEKHNSRVYVVPNANPEKASNNKNFIAGNASDNFSNLIQKHDIKIRKNAVVALEVLCTFSPDMQGELNIERWAKDSIEFAAKRFGGKENLLSADLHLDESTPHLHITIAPIVRKYNKRKEMEVMTLSARDLIGGANHVMSDLQTEYADAMAQHGLRRGKVRESTREVTYEDVSEMYAVIAKDKTIVSKVIKDLKKDLEKIENTNPLNIPKRKKLIETLYSKMAKVLKKLLGDNTRLRKQKNRLTREKTNATQKLSEARRELKAVSKDNALLKSELQRSESDRTRSEQQNRILQMESNPSQELRERNEFLEKQNRHLLKKHGLEHQNPDLS